MNDENRVDGQEQTEQQAVEEGFMIGDDEQALMREIGLPKADVNTEQLSGQAAQQRPQYLAHQVFSLR